VVKDRLVKNTVEEISVMSNSVLDELLAEVRDHIGFLYQLSENLALLDLLRSLATVSMSTGFVKENWSQYEYGP
jgi:DNA mismatch repair ATPase MutS